MKAPLSPQGQLRRRRPLQRATLQHADGDGETAKSVTRSPAARPNREVPLSAFLAHVCVRAVPCLTMLRQRRGGGGQEGKGGKRIEEIGGEGGEKPNESGYAATKNGTNEMRPETVVVWCA